MAAVPEERAVEGMGLPAELEAQLPAGHAARATPAVVLPRTVSVVGGPGSGRGTLCRKLAAEYPGLLHISIGDHIRQHVAAAGGALAEKIERAMVDGALVDPVLVQQLLEKAAADARRDGRAILLDGYPLTIGQAALMEEIPDVGRPAAVFFLDCPEHEMVRRVLQRSRGAIEESSVTALPSGRVDDNEATAIKLIERFTAQTLPVVNWAEKRSLLRVVQAGQVVDEAYISFRGHWQGMLLPPASVVVRERMPATVSILGGPGSGRSTMCRRLASEFEGLAHISVGELIRAHGMTAGGQAKKDADAEMAEGALVDPKLVRKLLEAAATEARAGGAQTVVLDGYPLTMGQVGAMKVMAGVGKPGAVFFLDCPEDEMIQRCVVRHAQSSSLSKRVDDNSASVVKLMERFTAQTLPVVDWADGRGLLRTVAAGQPANEAYADLRGQWTSLVGC
jgi:adenylate kinase